ncbi:MAG: glycosyltransferase [Bacteroidia bacterium]
MESNRCRVISKFEESLTKLKVLLYFDDSAESDFGYRDMELLSPAFDKCVVFPDVTVAAKKYPPAFTITSNYIQWKQCNPMKIMWENALYFLSILFLSFNEIRFSPKRLSEALKKLSSNYFKAQQVVQYIYRHNLQKEDITIYSFWLYDSVYLAFIKKLLPSVLIINRAHGGDIFENQPTLKNRVLLRKFQFQNIDKIITVSKDGADYLKKKYPQYSEKISTIYLGTASHNDINPFPVKGFTIVSCSHVRNVKRVDKIAEVILNLPFQVNWVHIGSENIYDRNTDQSIDKYLKIKEQIAHSDNVKFVAMGTVAHEQIMDYYKINPVHLFISLSETEGIPVSIMECISFGVPVMCTDVGGCREIVTEQTGILLPLETEISEICEKISAFKQHRLNTADARNGIKAYWEKHFNQVSNYQQLITSIKK